MDAQALLDQATAAIQAKQFDRARPLLMQHLRLNPRSEQGWLALASVMDDMEKAIDCLKRVLSLNPNNATAQEWLQFAEQEKARAGAVAEMTAEEQMAQIAISEPGDEARKVPRLGKYLLQYRLVTVDQLRAGLLAQRQADAAGHHKRLGDALVELGLLSVDNLNFVIEEQRQDGERPVPRLGRYLVDYNFITEAQLEEALVEQLREAASGNDRRLGDILLEQGAITEERLNFAIREQSSSFYSMFND